MQIYVLTFEYEYEGSEIYLVTTNKALAEKVFAEMEQCNEQKSAKFSTFTDGVPAY